MAGGSSFAGESDDSIISDINVTPLVDVVLVLLIVMMITMPAIVSTDLLNERELRVKLPQASEAVPLISAPQQLIINIEKDGTYTVRGVKLNDNGLEAALKQEFDTNPGRASVVIHGDKDARYQSIITAINLCVKVGIEDYRLGAEQD